MLKIHQGHQLKAMLFLLLFSVSLPASAMSAYVLGSGDVLHVSVYGVKELNTHSEVGPDGNVSFPLIGEVHVSGRPLKEVRALLKHKLTASGSIRRRDIIVELSKYRPFYITGSVANPGAYPYRLNMTVRQAIAVAGGGIVGRMPPNMVQDLAKIRGEYRSLWLEFVRRKIRTVILQAEVDGKPIPQNIRIDTDMVSADLIQNIIRLEREKALSIRANYQKGQNYLQHSLKRMGGEIKTIEKHIELTKGILRKHQKYLTKLIRKSSRGILTQRRLFQERRYKASNETQMMANRLNLSKALDNKGKLTRERDKEALDRKITLMKALELALVEHEKYNLQLVAAVEKMLTVQGAELGGCNNLEAKPEIVIFRKKKSLMLSSVAKKDNAIEPGDVIEINSPANKEMASILCSLRKKNTNTAFMQ